MSGTYNVQDAAYGGGASPAGQSDCTGAFQAALDAIAEAGGGCLYIPAGDYQFTGPGLSYENAAPLRITGDGPQVSNLRGASTADGVSYLDIQNAGAVTIDNISFYNDRYIGSFSAQNVNLSLDNVNWGKIANVTMQQGTAAQRVNQGIVLNACNYVDIDNCDVYASVNGIVVSGYSQVNNIRSTTIWTPAGTHVATAAAVLYQGQILTAHMSQCVFHDGDRGVYWTRDSAGHVPHLFFGYDLEPNNHSIAAMEFDYGAQVYLSQCLFSSACSIVGAEVPGLVFGPAFQGSALVDSCAWNGHQGHSVSIQGGAGYKFTGCEFGGNEVYKYAADTYDEINIGGGVREVTIDTCHFNVNALAGLGTSNPPRSAVSLAPGAANVTLTNCKGAGTGYGTAAILDGAGALVRRGNLGLGLADSTTGAGSTVATAASASLGAPVTIPASDARAGTVYKMTCFGTGTMAAGTAVALTVRLTLSGVNLGSFQPATPPAAGEPFSWRYECYLYVTAAGTSGSVTASAVFTWGSTPTVQNSAAQAVNTTQANQLVLTAGWASDTGSPAVSCAATLLERI
jgi:hypothetical protein